jgi:hypothetical protein
VVLGDARVVAPGEDSGRRRAAQFLHHRTGLLAVAADDRDVEHGHLGLRWITARLQAVLAEDGELAVQHAEVRGKIAAIAEPGRDGQRPLLAAAADDDRDLRHRPRIAGGFRQPEALAPVLPGARLPQCAQRLDGRLELVQPDPGRRERQAEPGVLTLPPAGPDAAERPPATQRIQRGRRYLQDQAHLDRPLPLLAGRLPCARGVRGLGLSLRGRDHRVPALSCDLRDRRSHPPQLSVEDRRGDRLVAGTVTPAALRRIGAEQHGGGGHAAVPSQVQVTAAPGRVEAQRVHHSRQAAAQPGRQDLVEQSERIVRRIQVVLATTHHCAQPVGGDHLVRAVVLRGPDRLPRPGRTDQHHERGIG